MSINLKAVNGALAPINGMSKEAPFVWTTIDGAETDCNTEKMEECTWNDLQSFACAGKIAQGWDMKKAMDSADIEDHVCFTERKGGKDEAARGDALETEYIKEHPTNDKDLKKFYSKLNYVEVKDKKYKKVQPLLKDDKTTATTKTDGCRAEMRKTKEKCDDVDGCKIAVMEQYNLDKDFAKKLTVANGMQGAMYAVVKREGEGKKQKLVFSDKKQDDVKNYKQWRFTAMSEDGKSLILDKDAEAKDLPVCKFNDYMAAYCADKKHEDTKDSKNEEERACFLEDGEEPGDAAKAAREAKEGSSAGVVIGIIGALAVVGGLVYCWKAKKCCFAQKDELEGGDKKEFQRNAKVSLVDN